MFKTNYSNEHNWIIPHPLFTIGTSYLRSAFCWSRSWTKTSCSTSSLRASRFAIPVSAEYLAERYSLPQGRKWFKVRRKIGAGFLRGFVTRRPWNSWSVTHRWVIKKMVHLPTSQCLFPSKILLLQNTYKCYRVPPHNKQQYHSDQRSERGQK